MSISIQYDDTLNDHFDQSHVAPLYSYAVGNLSKLCTKNVKKNCN